MFGTQTLKDLRERHQVQGPSPGPRVLWPWRALSAVYKDGLLHEKLLGATWTSKMAKIMEPILPTVSLLRYWAITLGSFGGPGTGI